MKDVDKDSFSFVEKGSVCTRGHNKNLEDIEAGTWELLYGDFHHSFSNRVLNSYSCSIMGMVLKYNDISSYIGSYSIMYKNKSTIDHAYSNVHTQVQI